MLTAYKIDYNRRIVATMEFDELKEYLSKTSGLFDFSSKQTKDFVWIDITNPPKEQPSQEEMTIMQDILKIHHLVIEDCITKKHFPKAEDYDNYSFFIISKMLNSSTAELESNKIGFILGPNYILTYRHNEVKEMNTAKNMVFSKPEEFNAPVDIFYVITDQIIDDYVDLIESFTTKTYEIEELIFAKPNSAQILKKVNFIRKNLIILRRNALIQKQIFNDLTLGNITGLDTSKRSIYFKDICDHLDRVLAKIDNQREYISGILNIQLGLSTQKLNSLIKFLTVISAVLLPATLIASIFGMNFSKMPLILQENGFYLTLSIMVFCSISTLIFFYNKKWI